MIITHLLYMAVNLWLHLAFLGILYSSCGRRGHSEPPPNEGKVSKQTSGGGLPSATQIRETDRAVMQLAYAGRAHARWPASTSARPAKEMYLSMQKEEMLMMIAIVSLLGSDCCQVLAARPFAVTSVRQRSVLRRIKADLQPWAEERATVEVLMNSKDRNC